MPFAERSFDGAYMLHVGMNIEDKEKLASEVARVLRPRSSFGIYDVMRTGPGDLAYRVPWASPAGDWRQRDTHHRRHPPGLGY
jgi:ubiquinone/menaquinone biosynthesis C-methylase UbiE